MVEERGGTMKTITISIPDEVKVMHIVLGVENEVRKSWGLTGNNVIPEDGKHYEFRLTEEKKDGNS